MRRLLVIGSMLALVLAGQETQHSQSGLPEGYIALLRSDVQTRKLEIIRQNLKLSESEGEKFWPQQRNYETDLSKLGDERLQIIRDYAKDWDNLSDANAKNLGERLLSFQKKRVQLREKYFARIGKEVSATVAAKFFQVENQLEDLIDLEIGSQIPLVK